MSQNEMLCTYRGFYYSQMSLVELGGKLIIATIRMRYSAFKSGATPIESHCAFEC